MSTRPTIVTTEHLKYLDRLRQSGVTNMWGAGAYLESTFSLSAKTARAILMYWMETFGDADR